MFMKLTNFAIHTGITCSFMSRSVGPDGVHQKVELFEQSVGRFE
jgi:hypothetical protein